MFALYCRSQVKTMIFIQQYDRPNQVEAYSKFRLEPPQELVDIIVDYLGKKCQKPFGLAVDVGCGSGQSTIILSPYFQSVVGCDVSKSQIREANLCRKAKNVLY
ncbi:methyltransf_25 domain-containing protein, partial [Caerostris darwini]